MSAQTGEIAALWGRAESGGRTKMVLGVVVAILGVGGNLAALTYLDASGAPAGAGALLFFIWGVYLVYRGQRQLRIAHGEVHSALVLEARGQGHGKPGEQPVTYTLEVDVQLPSDSGAPIGVVANTTNVFLAAKAKGLVGQSIRVLWSPAYPADAYADVDRLHIP